MASGGWRRGFLLGGLGGSDARAPADSAAIVRAVALPLNGDADLDPLLAAIARSKAHIILIGEASHGTHQFYALRAAITRRLCAEQGVAAVCLEADWPDTQLLNAFVRGEPLPQPAHVLVDRLATAAAANDASAKVALDTPPARRPGGDEPVPAEAAEAVDALAGFQRFPTWMWRNADVLEFLGWLRDYNAAQLAALPAGHTPLPLRAQALAGTGMYGLDLYALYSSIRVVLDFLERTDPTSAARARLFYACFDSSGCDAQQYGAQATMGIGPSCESEALGVLKLLQQQLSEATRCSLELARRGAAGDSGALPPSTLQAKRDALRTADALHAVAEDARLVSDAEHYYRSMFAGHDVSWNLRDTHMLNTLVGLVRHLRLRAALTTSIAAEEAAAAAASGAADEALPPPSQSVIADAATDEPRVVVWMHNSHLGDARATEMGRARGEVNLGQLCREHFGAARVFNIGFSTFSGTVTAARAWDGPSERMQLNEGLAGSYEELFHRVATLPAPVAAAPARTPFASVTNPLHLPLPRFMIDLRTLRETAAAAAAAAAEVPVSTRAASDALEVLSQRRLQRAVGVIYAASTERHSHYFVADLPQQFDFILHIDHTRAVEPLEKRPLWRGPPADEETFPSGL